MKKEILAMMACGMMMTSAYAQEFKNGDFETGDLTGWQVWENKTNDIVDVKKAHSGNHAVEVRVGMWQQFNITYEAGTEYEITIPSIYGVSSLSSVWNIIILIQANLKKLQFLM
jgi:hypothetical protein